MGKRVSRAVFAGGAGGGVVIAAAQTKPEDAISNLGGWLKLLGVDHVPMFLNTLQADTWATIVGLMMIGVSFLWWGLSKRRANDGLVLYGEGLEHVKLLRGSSDRIPYVRLREIAHEYGVKFERYGVNQSVGHDLEGVLKEAAANGKLTVSGRPYNGPIKHHDPLIPIPASHFREYSFRHGALDYQLPNEQTRTETMQMAVKGLEGLEGVTYYDLHVSESEARAILRDFGAQHSERIMAGVGNTLIEINANLDYQRKEQARTRMRRIAEGKE